MRISGKCGCVLAWTGLTCALTVSHVVPSSAQDAGARVPIELKLSTAVGTAFALGKAAAQWTALVNDRGGGRLAVAVFPGATLAERDPAREFVALREGKADLALGSTLYWSGQVSALGVVGLPWIAPEHNALAALATGAVRAALFAAIEKSGATPLATAPLGHRAIATISRAIRTPDDVAGLAIRMTATPYLVDFYAGLKALPTAMSYADADAAFRTGALNAQEGTAATFAATHLETFGFRYVTLWDAIGEIAIFAVNTTAWNRLDTDARNIVRDAALEAADNLSRGAIAEEESALASLRGRGISLLRLTESGRAAFADAARPVYAKWALVAGSDITQAAETASADARK